MSQTPNRTVWVGAVGGVGWEAGGSFDFVIEQYGSWQIEFLLFVLFFLVMWEGTRQAEDACYKRAYDTCGRRGIKSVNVARRVTGTTLRMDAECSFECGTDDSTG